MQQVRNKNKYDISIKISIGVLSLLIIFYISNFLTIDELNKLPSDLKQSLSTLINAQYLSLIIGSLLAILIFRWMLIQQKQNVFRRELAAKIKALDKSQAAIEFDMDGIILSANDNFLQVMGYTREELVGRHHSMLVDDTYKESLDYKNFWEKLKRGEYETAEYKRIAKNGKEVWLQSSYNPIMNSKGKPIKVLKFAIDVTLRKMQNQQIILMTEKLQKVGKQIITDSNEISVGINQLEETATSQASSASEQAASVTEICATMEEIKTTSQQTLKKASELGESAKRTSNEGEKGREALEKMSNSMQILQARMQQISSTIISLNDKTQQIGEITEVVADVAKQSKMLALNASIEAAKAGEAGKGFAVVAGEVKELAEKSQQSTDHVQKILQDIRHTAERAVIVTEEGTKSVDDSIQQVKVTEKIINSLGEVIEESSMASLQIVSAVREESIAINQVDISLKEINKVTGLLGAATEQTKLAILGLAKVAESLKQTVTAYNLDNSDGMF